MKLPSSPQQPARPRLSWELCRTLFWAQKVTYGLYYYSGNINKSLFIFVYVLCMFYRLFSKSSTWVTVGSITVVRPRTGKHEFTSNNFICLHPKKYKNINWQPAIPFLLPRHPKGQSNLENKLKYNIWINKGKQIKNMSGRHQRCSVIVSFNEMSQVVLLCF